MSYFPSVFQHLEHNKNVVAALCMKTDEVYTAAGWVATTQGSRASRLTQKYSCFISDIFFQFTLTIIIVKGCMHISYHVELSTLFALVCPGGHVSSLNKCNPIQHCSHFGVCCCVQVLIMSQWLRRNHVFFLENSTQIFSIPFIILNSLKSSDKVC